MSRLLRTVDPWLDLAAAGLAGVLCLNLAAVSAFLAVAAVPLGWQGALLVARPLALAVIALTLAAARAWAGSAGAAFSAASALALAGLVVADARLPSSWRLPAFLRLLPLLAPLAAVVAWRLHPRRRMTPMALASLACGAAALAVLPFRSQTSINELGLVGGAPKLVWVYDYSSSAHKDRYPVCRFEYNSFGYRDGEPPAALKRGQRRVLLVGDSFVWGDGIPTNGETLGARLGEELERRAPGRFSVMSAAYPGLGLYGYARFIEANAARFRPALVVIGYLGNADEDPFDLQFLADSLPRRPWARNLLLNLGTLQQVHEASAIHSGRLWTTPRNREYFAGLLRAVARDASERGYRVLAMDYGFTGGAAAASVIPVFSVPEPLRFASRANEYWYGKDFHPKPELNRALAGALAAAVVRLEAR